MEQKSDREADSVIETEKHFEPYNTNLVIVHFAYLCVSNE